MPFNGRSHELVKFVVGSTKGQMDAFTSYMWLEGQMNKLLIWHSWFRASWYTKMTKNMQLCRIIYCSLTALHVSSDIFAHHQEHLNCIHNFTTYVNNTRSCEYSLYAPDDERKYRSKHVKQSRNNKLSYTVTSFWLFSLSKAFECCMDREVDGIADGRMSSWDEWEVDGICNEFCTRRVFQLCCTQYLNPLNAELNPICYLLALLAHNFLHVSRIRVKSLTLRLLMSYIYIWSTYAWCF